MSQPIPYCGIPRTPAEWKALAKVGRGDARVSKNELRRLFMLGLVDRQLGDICLTKHGRDMLELYQRSVPGASQGGPDVDEQLPLFRDSGR
jgi:hypothetical protein